MVRPPRPIGRDVCGERSGIDVLDLDRKYEEASAWYCAHRDRLPPTRTFRTRSGGAHLYFRHALGVRNSASKIAPGIDVRGEGGFIVAWFVAGLPCLDPSPPAPWPPWLLKLILPAPAPAQRPQHKPPRTTDAAIAGILQSVASAPEGQRNARLTGPHTGSARAWWPGSSVVARLRCCWLVPPLRPVCRSPKPAPPSPPG